MSFTSILQERSLRLYNLRNLNDPREFVFASNLLLANEKKIEDAKDNLFIMSFCESNILKNLSSEFNMWRLYGQQGKGLGIVFSIANEPENWNDFHLSKVYYGTNERSNFKKLLDELENLNNEGQVFDIDLGKICAFHKSNLFKPEMEVRILFDKRILRTGKHSRTTTHQGKLVFPIIKSDLFKVIENKDKVRFLQIPIYHNELRQNNGNDILVSTDLETPLLKIEEIIIGYDFQKIEEITDIIGQLCANHLGYKPKIKQTRLTGYYWGTNPTKKKQ